MTPCLKNIVSVKDYCNLDNNQESLSGYELMTAPELSLSTIQAMIKDDQTKTRDFLISQLDLATLEIRNDFLGVITANEYVANISEEVFESSSFGSDLLPASNLERGLSWYAVSNQYNSIKAAKIQNIYLNSNEDKNGVVIKIYDGDSLSSFTVNVKVGINTFAVNYPIKSRFIKVVMDSNQIITRSTTLTCFIGCNGTTPNKCGYTKAVNGDVVSTKESFGLGISFSCFCDFEKILCNLGKEYVGKLIYLKTRIILLDNRIMSDRNNNLIVYGREEAMTKKSELVAEYNFTWNILVKSLPGIMKKYNSDCITCTGISYKPNI